MMKCVYIRASALNPVILRMTDEHAASAFNAGLVTYTTKQRWKSLGRKYGYIKGSTIAECLRPQSN